jgi:hypothetical protein
MTAEETIATKDMDEEHFMKNNWMSSKVHLHQNVCQQSSCTVIQL